MSVVPNFQPLILDFETKLAELRTQETEYASVLSRLEGLEVNETTKAIFRDFANGKLTIQDLDGAIDRYLEQGA